MKIKFILFIVLFVFQNSFSQEKKKSAIIPYKVGFLYNYGDEDNFIFNDTDYSYKTNTYKLQAFYKLGSWKKNNFELIVQPQVQFLEHRLINEQFITPDQEDYLAKRLEFTKSKSMNLYGLEMAFVLSRNIFDKLDFQTSISLGFSYIDTRTERLAKGFTFIENFSLGFSYNIFKNSFLFIGSNFGHVSNLNFQKPNDGYNILGVEVGYSFLL